MIKKLYLPFLISLMACSCKTGNSDGIRRQISEDSRLDIVAQMCLDIVKTGFNAGDSYGEVWIRDYNTFIELSMEVMPDSLIRENLNTFFAFQDEDGNIADGFIPKENANLDDAEGYKYRFSAIDALHVAHKNTVETDQETSLVQAIGKYVRKSGNTRYLEEEFNGKTIYARMSEALNYLLNERTDADTGLLFGATTVDWGDVQPEHFWGVAIDENTHYAIDIYDNAMFVLALDDMIEFAPCEGDRDYWTEVKDNVVRNVRKYLWDERNQKFYPHIYLNGSPFNSNFDENAIYYHGGTAVACLAHILSPEETLQAYERMEENKKAAHAQTIGLTVYPTYPAGSFKNAGMYPYGYQNGGDWTWFGARMVHSLIEQGFVEEAYQALSPMLDRVIENKSFNEWYTPAGEPMGSGTFRGEAGVLYTAIEMLRGQL